MAKFRVLGGDFKTGRGRFTIRNFSLPSFNRKALFETVALKEVFHISRAPMDMLEVIIKDPEQLKLVRQNPEQTTFIATLKDKRKFIGIADKQTFIKLVEALRSQKDRKVAPNAVASS
ncbi:hypothetical protein [Kangiella sp. TOML190]|uniref:hypothetical protein n=1 Tax=Kangiella sp. TOML190 TaxID=2931351 RepID=UPI00203E91C6|nr:hypothetical protein [Kangiella sp. TOML190]